jgi:hypothetical protein
MLKVQYRMKLNENMNTFHQSLVLTLHFHAKQFLLTKADFIMFYTHNPWDYKMFHLTFLGRLMIKDENPPNAGTHLANYSVINKKTTQYESPVLWRPQIL